MIEPLFAGVVEGGKLKLEKREQFEKYIATLSGDVKIHVFKKKKTRSNEENRYYWGVVIKLLAEDTGMDDEEVHDALKIKFLQVRGKKMLTVRSTASLSTAEFEAYLETIRRWAVVEMNILIPLPNEAQY